MINSNLVSTLCPRKDLWRLNTKWMSIRINQSKFSDYDKRTIHKKIFQQRRLAFHDPRLTLTRKPNQNKVNGKTEHGSHFSRPTKFPDFSLYFFSIFQCSLIVLFF